VVGMEHAERKGGQGVAIVPELTRPNAQGMMIKIGSSTAAASNGRGGEHNKDLPVKNDEGIIGKLGNI